jgi:ubiquinone/menaquinone biosynthesis C-methylase UbiE
LEAKTTDLSEAEIQLMIALIELERPIETPNNNRYRFYPKDLQEASKYFGEFLVDWRDAYQSLPEKGILVPIGGGHRLTHAGECLAEQFRRDRPPIWYWYKGYYIRTKNSKAHAQYCEQVFGLNLCQDGFSDMNQIHRLIEVAAVKGSDRILDLGCGNGMISEYISDTTGAEVYGIDYIPEAVEQAICRTKLKRDRLKFSVGNLDHIDFPDSHFNLVISIDTLYMPNDLRSTLGQMKRVLRPAGAMAIYYTRFSNEGTDLARVLADSGLRYKAYDFSRENYELMQRKRQVAIQLREEYMQEGNGCLYDSIYAQSVGDPAPYDPGQCRMSRQLYYVTPETRD